MQAFNSVSSEDIIGILLMSLQDNLQGCLFCV